jgi:hypothetical protein
MPSYPHAWIPTWAPNFKLNGVATTSSNYGWRGEKLKKWVHVYGLLLYVGGVAGGMELYVRFVSVCGLQKPCVGGHWTSSGAAWWHAPVLSEGWETWHPPRMLLRDTHSTPFTLWPGSFIRQAAWAGESVPCGPRAIGLALLSLSEAICITNNLLPQHDCILTSHRQIITCSIVW